MKICQVTSVHDRYDPRIFLKIATSVYKNFNRSCLLIMDTLPNEIKNGVSIISTGKKYKHKIKRILFSWKYLKKYCLTIDADIYHLHDPELLPLGVFLKKHNKKVIFDSHEDYQNISEKKWIPKIFRKLVKTVYLKKEKRVLRKFDGVISVTPHIVERLKRINRNSICITNYPILIEKYNHNFDNKNLCFGGNYIYAHSETIKALELINDASITYKLVVDLDNPAIQSLESLEGWKYVEPHNLMPFDELRRIYKGSSIGLCIDRYNVNLGNTIGSLGVIKLFEYMAEGMPVICTDYTIWKQIIDKYNCGICVNPYDVNEIANAIKTLIYNKELMIEMGRNARRAAEEEFNWGTQEQKLIKFYKSIFEGSEL